VECRSVVSVQSSPAREYWIIKIVVPKKGLEPAKIRTSFRISHIPVFIEYMKLTQVSSFSIQSMKKMQ
jgi:hypothetical protein